MYSDHLPVSSKEKGIVQKKYKKEPIQLVQNSSRSHSLLCQERATEAIPRDFDSDLERTLED